MVATRICHVEAEIIIIELSTLALHIVDRGQVTERAILCSVAQHVFKMCTVVADRLAAVVPLT